MRRPHRDAIRPKRRSTLPFVDRLEARELLSSAPGFGQSSTAAILPLPNQTAHPMFTLGSMVIYPTPPAGAYTPPQIAGAYNFSSINFAGTKGDGSGQTIAIVDAQDDPNIQADLNVFDSQFGLPAATVARVNQTGGSTLPSTDSSGGWELEESLDVEWAHAMAPGAKILLVEANSANDSDLLAAVDYASAHASVVSMSWGGNEFFGETSSLYDGHFNHAGVVYVASSGDSGAPASWPAVSPNVLAVGGTSLTVGAGNTWAGESGWSGSGGGPSTYEVQPSYQNGVVTLTSARANPDVAYDADPSTGFAIYDSFNYQGVSYGWVQIGGTSAGAPQWSALLAIADQGRALSGKPALDSSNQQEVATTLYQNPADLHDIMSGTSTGSPAYSARVGYDFVTGLGTPNAGAVVQSLDGTVTTSVQDHYVISASSTAQAGNAISVIVTADSSGGAADSGYRGTVQFSSSDVQAGLPSSYTFNQGDAGSHTFSITLKTAGSQSITASDASNSSITATASGISVSPATANQLVFAGIPATSTSGVPFSFTLTAKDPYGNIATGYAGVVTFSSSDGAAALPGTFTFSSGNQGTHTFSATLSTAGAQSITAKDSGSAFSITSPSVSVVPTAPINLVAAAGTTGQINLSWSGSSGATSYLVQRSTNGSSGWTQIASTAAGTLTYQDKNLTSGTTYFYRVQATSAGGNSAFSSVAHATTTGSPPANDTLWSNSYNASENAYSWGSYELGVKFEASVAGTVTGLRFFKTSFMNGFTHLGHLWSSNGTLLATATYTNETYSGWQQVNLSNPVSISPNTVYIVSFSSGGGLFGITTGYFNNAGVTNGPLQALANGVSGGDGVYHSGNGTFPTTSGSGMNFWADLVFSPSSSSTTHVVLAAVPSGTASHAAPVSSPTGSQSVAIASPADVASSNSLTTTTTHRHQAPHSTSVSYPNRGVVPQTFAFGSGRWNGTI
jgi:hypothetical protein